MTITEVQHKQRLEKMSDLQNRKPVKSTPELSDIDAAIIAMDNLAVMNRHEVYFRAGDPGYPGSFTRDSEIAMALRGDPLLLESQIDYSVRRRGKKQDPKTGEEPGKHHHELPNVNMNGLSTAYNACDTTAQSLLSMAALVERGYRSDVLLRKYADAIKDGVAYIKSHVNHEGLFMEDPWFAGDENPDGRKRRFALKVTYWKDSELNRQGSREPHYPIVYTLAHFQNARALEAVGKITADHALIDIGKDMIKAGIDHLWKDDHFITARDEDGVIDPISSDSLEALLYIESSWLPDGYARAIEQYMELLVTEAGYRAALPATPDVDPYHMMVWAHSQAVMHAAAQSHRLHRATEITTRIMPFMLPQQGVFSEQFDPETLLPSGNGMQLWTIGAYLYFQNPKNAILY